MLAPYYIFLMYKNDSTYEKLVDIISRPDIGDKAETVEKTTQSDDARSFRQGVKSGDQLEFTAPLTSADYTKLVALDGVEEDFSVWFGGTKTAGVVSPTGADLKLNFKGYLTVAVAGGGINDPTLMNITITKSSGVTKGE